MTKAELDKFAEFTFEREARRDSKGRIAVYKLPSGDGGGSFEVAGINERYDFAIAHELRNLIKEGEHETAERLAKEYYIENTEPVAKWSKISAIEAFLRDAMFHRGRRGAARILQLALGVTDDGAVGPKTRSALRVAEERSPLDLIHDLHAACNTYERKVAPPVGARAKFWKGLVSRWKKRTDFALSLL